MSKTGWILCALSVAIIAAAIILFILPGKTSAPTTDTSQTPPSPQIPDTIVVQSLFNTSAITSPLTVTGKARGSWYFEAQFPVELKNAQGKVIAQGIAHAQGDWMTKDFVPFSVTLTYPAQPPASQGTLILKNDNPSGDPSRDKALSIPVTFKDVLPG
jgi:hypothetical protein